VIIQTRKGRLLHLDSSCWRKSQPRIKRSDFEHISTGNPPTLIVLHGPVPENHYLQQVNYRKKKKKKPNNLHRFKYREDQKLQQSKTKGGTKTTIALKARGKTPAPGGGDVKPPPLANEVLGFLSFKLQTLSL